MTTSTVKTNLLGLTQQEMEKFFDSIGEKRFRAGQVMKWIHHFGVDDFDAMTNVSKALRDKLKAIAEVRGPEVVSEDISSDGTRKWVVRVASGSCVETVYIPQGKRGTLCVSSQAGCALDCSFCSTGKQGFNSNLTAAEVIGQLRHELSASMARDNSLLEERSRIMETLGALLDAINHASTEQRSAIDALVSSSTELLERAGSQFAAKVESEAGKLIDIGSSITGGALEVASLGEAFGHAVQLFSESNDKMLTALQRIDGGLAKSLTRSDEQLAYYVAQAREIIDLSIMSQKKMVNDLQRATGSEA